MALNGGGAVNLTHQLVWDAFDTTVPPAGSECNAGYCWRAWVKGTAVERGNPGEVAAENPDTVAGAVAG